MKHLKIILVAIFLQLAIASVSWAVINLYVDTDNGNNANNGSSWALAKANAYNAVNAIPSTISDAYVVHCKGATADTLLVNIATRTGTSSVNTITLQTDAADRHSGVWNTNKYRIETTDQIAVDIVNPYTNIFGLQIKMTLLTTQAHAIGHYVSASGVVNIGYNIIQEVENNPDAIDSCGIHSSAVYGTLYVYNNIFYGFANGSHADMIGIAAYVPVNIYNNTFYSCHTGVRLTNNDTTNVQAINNLFISVTTPFQGTSSSLAAGSDYNATDQSSLGITVTGGGDTHERTSVSTTGLFVNAASYNFNLASTATQGIVRNGGKTDSGTGLFSDDITGTTRVAPWDIGAFGTVQSNAVVMLLGSGGGTVTSSPSGISCGDTCTYGYNKTSTVTLTATPNTTSTFTSWSGAGGCSGSGTCTLTLGADQAAIATFATFAPGAFTPSSLVPGGLNTVTQGGLNTLKF